jgi:hypothetical protein
MLTRASTFVANRSKCSDAPYLPGGNNRKIDTILYLPTLFTVKPKIAYSSLKVVQVKENDMQYCSNAGLVHAGTVTDKRSQQAPMRHLSSYAEKGTIIRLSKLFSFPSSLIFQLKAFPLTFGATRSRRFLYSCTSESQY